MKRTCNMKTVLHTNQELFLLIVAEIYLKKEICKWYKYLYNIKVIDIYMPRETISNNICTSLVFFISNEV
jgi:hypothetical protein